jgi:hypothetical protein
MILQRRAATQTACLAIVPCLLFFSGLLLRGVIGTFEADPDYVYLLNGLNLLTFHAPGHYDHPGTTVQIIAALSIVPAWLVSMPVYGTSGVTNAVLSHPQYFLHVISFVLIALAAAAIFYMGRRVQAAANLATALAAQISILACFFVMHELNRVSPEPLLLASSAFLAGYLAPAVLQPEQFVQTRTYALGLGMLLGFIMVTKVTAIPLLGTIFLLHGRNFRITAVTAGLMTGLVLTLPIAIHYRQMAHWFASLFIHTDVYGSGPAGVPAASNLWHGFTFLLGQAPEVFIAFAFYIVSLPLLQGATRRAVAICVLILAVGILMVLKEPNARYFMPIIGAIVLANAAIASWSLMRGGPVRVLGAILALLLVIGVGRNAFATSNWAEDARHSQIDNRKLLATATASGCRIVFFYGTNTVAYNLAFGHEYTPGQFDSDLDRLYPQSLFYNPYLHRFETFKGPISPKEVEGRSGPHPCIHLVGSLLARYPDFGIPGNELTLVARTDHGLVDSAAIYAWHPQ